MEGCWLGGFWIELGIGVCSGVFGLWWVFELKAGRSGKVEFRGVGWRSLGRVGGLENWEF